MSEWQPIETAPTDGTVILTDDGTTTWFNDRWYLCTWSGHVPRCADWGHEISEVEPVIWMPLPAPTTYADAEAKGHWQRQAEAAQKNAALFQQDCALHVAEKARKDEALDRAAKAFGQIAGTVLGVAMSGDDHPDQDGALMGVVDTCQEVFEATRAAIRSLASPAPKGET